MHPLEVLLLYIPLAIVLFFLVIKIVSIEERLVKLSNLISEEKKEKEVKSFVERIRAVRKEPGQKSFSRWGRHSV
jgi:predicted methyltransferase